MTTTDLRQKDPFFEEGYSDFHIGYEIDDCPYSEGTDGEYGWQSGWHAAYKNESEK